MRKIANILKGRPLFFFCLGLMPFFAVYACLIHTHPPFPFREKQNVTLSGTVTEKVLNDSGSVGAFYVKGKYNFKCYVNDEDISPASIPIGSEVCVVGKVSSFRTARNPGEFNAEAFYENRGYLFYMTVTSVKTIKFPKIPVKEFFFQKKCLFAETVKQYCPIEYGTINTILFGDKTNLEDKRATLYKQAGLSHFLVISGLHISVAGGGIYMFLRRLGMQRKTAALFGISFILFYGFLVGFSVSVFRAVCMYFLRLLADILKRTYDILTALAISAILTLSVNPLWIRDSAFLYSYTAVLFTGLYYSYIRKRREEELFNSLYSSSGLPAFIGKIKMNVAVPILIYFSLLPISLYFQAYSNILSIPLNLILGLFTTPILLFGAVGFIAGCLHLVFIAGFSDYVCAILLSLIDKVSGLLSPIKAFKIIYQPKLSIIFLYYIILIVCLFIFPYIISEKACLLMIFMGAVLLGTSPDPYPLITVLDVDQGDCIVIKTGKHTAVISDCGSTGRTNIGQNVVIPYLHSLGITTVTHIFVSHGDQDHINGIPNLLENNNEISVKNIVFPKLRKEMWSDNLVELRNLAVTNKVNTVSIPYHEQISYNASSFTCLNPLQTGLSGDSNRDSLVLWYRIYDFDALLAGDATEETESTLSLPNCTFELLKVAHHGSRYSSSEEFLNRLSPFISIISVGQDNTYGHPHSDTLSRLSNINTDIYRTDRVGAVTVHIYPRKYITETYISK